MNRSISILALGLFLITAELFAQYGLPSFEKEGYPRFSVDYAAFKGSGGESFLEVYTQIGFQDLRFIKHVNQFVASYELEVSVMQGDNLVRRRSFIDTVVVNDFKRTTAPLEYRLTIQGFLLKPGNYLALVVIRDQESERTVVKKLPVFLPDYTGNSLAISDLEFARKIAIKKDGNNPFTKNGRFVEPNAARAYGYLATNIYLYYEIYGLVPPTKGMEDALIVNYKISTPDGTIKKYLQKRAKKPGASCVHSVLLPVGDLETGRYVLEVEVYDPLSNQRAKTSKDFVVGWDVLAFSEQNSDELIEQLAYIATPEEITQLKKLPESYRRAGILSFWKAKDPTPETELNERMLEFYRRVAYVNQKYPCKGQKGWQTDQGKIYIKYGPPDSIQRSFSAAENKPYEVWEYMNPKQRFVFVEEGKAGTFALYSEATPPNSRQK